MKRMAWRDELGLNYGLGMRAWLLASRKCRGSIGEICDIVPNEILRAPSFHWIRRALKRKIGIL